jgi:hypothetical protein
VSWSGSDGANGSGIATYQVYVSDNGNPYTLWQPATAATSATYAGQVGHTYGFYSVATDKAGNVQTTPAAAQAGTTVALFVDDFNRPDSPTLGSNWTQVSGVMKVQGNQLLVAGSGPALAVYKSAALTSTEVQASFALPATGTQYAGVVARYSAAGYYLGQVIGQGGKFTASLYRYQGGAFTPLGSAVPLNSGSGTLRLNVEGRSLTLFLNGQPLTSAYDLTFTSGTTGVRGGPGATLGNFAGGPVGLTAVTLPFSDTFTQPDGSPLSGSWSQQAGDFTVQGGRLQASAAGSLATINVATPAANVAVQANIALSATGTQYAGVVARYSGPGTANYYLGEIVGSAGKYTAYLFRNQGGTLTALASAPAPGGSGTLLLDVAGSSLKLLFNGQLLTYAYDSALTSGSAGVWASQGATLDNFTAAASTTPVTQLPFTDNFTGSSGTQLSGSWTEREGNFAVQSGQLRGNGSGLNLATVNLSPTAADVAVQAHVALSGSQYAGLVARYSGTGDGNMYLGEVVGTNGHFTAYIMRHVGATWTVLKSRALSGGTGTLLFTVKGSHLQLSWNGVVVCDVTDAAIAGPGLAGVRGSAGALYSGFSAKTS